MRQRKAKHQEERLAALAHRCVPDPAAYKGRWQSLAAEALGHPAPLFLEIGCGRGHFLCAHAAARPDCFYLGAEGQKSVLLKAMELAEERALPNLRFLPDYVQDPALWFGEAELSGIYLNFSDPWPGNSGGGRRLTHRRYLTAYRTILRPGAALECKTDNDKLFDFTLKELEALGWAPALQVWDLHATELPARLVTTQYEERFLGQGLPIHYLKLLR